MNEKQKVFAEEYIKDLSPQNAAIRAGYAPKNAKITGQKILKKNDVKSYIDKLSFDRCAKNEIESEWILSSLKQIAISGLQEYQVKIPTVKGKTKNQKYITMTSLLNPRDAIKALELLGKFKQLFSDKKIGDEQTTVIIKNYE